MFLTLERFHVLITCQIICTRTLWHYCSSFFRSKSKPNIWFVCRTNHFLAFFKKSVSWPSKKLSINRDKSLNWNPDVHVKLLGHRNALLYRDQMSMSRSLQRKANSITRLPIPSCRYLYNVFIWLLAFAGLILVSSICSSRSYVLYRNCLSLC